MRETLKSLTRSLLPTTLAPIVTVNKEDFCSSCRQFFDDFRNKFPFLNVQFRFVGENANGAVRARP